MKNACILLLMLVGLAAKAQTRNYLKMFDPNGNKAGEQLKTSKEKTVVVIGCNLGDLAFETAEDSLRSLEEVTTYDAQGRIVEQHDFLFSVIRRYKYDDKNRVTGYSEQRADEEGRMLLDLTLKYDKKGKITSIENASAKAGAKTAIYYHKEERLVISEAFSFSDELRFKNGRLVDIKLKNEFDFVEYTAEILYDEEGRLSQQKGEYLDGEYMKGYEYQAVYDAAGKKVLETEVFWPVSSPEEKAKTVTEFSYSEKDELIQVTKNTPDGQYLSMYEYGADGRISLVSVFDGEYLLVSLCYRYL
ncbi:MAG TPA: hypothetical protein VEC12_07375 [Bacteroidia bacterium]|nr:hypothetical protein [Bacteroidia bacterium]